MSEKFNAKKLAFAGVSLALAYALSFITLFHMPTGGSVTLLSMFFVTVIGSFYGPVIGISAGFAYAFLQFFQNRDYILSVWQVLFDYFLSFGALGIGGFFHRRKNGILTGYIVSVFFRFIFTSLSSMLFWSEYLTLPENIPNRFLALLTASALYNFSYIGTEAVLTVLILLLPPVKKILLRLKKSAAD